MGRSERAGRALRAAAPGWPNERQAVTLGLFFLAVMMLVMAYNQPALWDVKLFEIILQAVVLTGLLNLVGGFHFSANKLDETKALNTRAAFDTMRAIAEQDPARSPTPDNPEGEPQ